MKAAGDISRTTLIVAKRCTYCSYQMLYYKNQSRRKRKQPNFSKRSGNLKLNFQSALKVLHPWFAKKNLIKFSNATPMSLGKHT